MPDLSQSECSCRVAAPRRESALLWQMHSKYVWRVDEIDDATEFDPACPYHGESGSMIATLQGRV